MSDVTHSVKKNGHVMTTLYCLGEIEDSITVDPVAGIVVG